MVTCADDCAEIYGVPRGAGSGFGGEDGGDVLRENGGGEGVGLRGR